MFFMGKKTGGSAAVQDNGFEQEHQTDSRLIFGYLTHGQDPSDNSVLFTLMGHPVKRFDIIYYANSPRHSTPLYTHIHTPITNPGVRFVGSSCGRTCANSPRHSTPPPLHTPITNLGVRFVGSSWDRRPRLIFMQEKIWNHFNFQYILRHWFEMLIFVLYYLARCILHVSQMTTTSCVTSFAWKTSPNF
jgi:hypothetical protein